MGRLDSIIAMSRFRDISNVVDQQTRPVGTRQTRQAGSKQAGSQQTDTSRRLKKQATYRQQGNRSVDATHNELREINGGRKQRKTDRQRDTLGDRQLNRQH